MKIISYHDEILYGVRVNYIVYKHNINVFCDRQIEKWTFGI